MKIMWLCMATHFSLQRLSSIPQYYSLELSQATPSVLMSQRKLMNPAWGYRFRKISLGITLVVRNMLEVLYNWNACPISLLQSRITS